MAYFNNNGIVYLRGPGDALYIKFDHHIFKRQNGCFPKVKWICDDREKTFCDAYVKTNNWIHEDDLKIHNHSSHNEKIDLYEAIVKMRRRALRNMLISAGDVITEVRDEYSLERDGKVLTIPNIENLKRSIQAFRQSQFPPPPKTLEEVCIEGRWRLDAFGNQPFLQIDDGTSDRILGFFTKMALKVLCKTSRVIADGTFKVRPSIFAQLYVLHGKIFGKYFPCLFFLLPDKSEVTYDRMLRLIKIKAREFGFIFCPEIFQIDYENFFRIKVQGCLFHFSQCIWRQVQDLGLVVQYKEIEEVRTYFRRMSALPLLPDAILDDCYFEFAEDWPDRLDNAKAREFLDYMVKTWLDENATFKREWWNQFENQGPRTTNHAEGWHRKLNASAGNHELALFPFINLLHRIQLSWNCEFDDLISMKDKARRKKYVRIDESIANAKRRLIDDDITPLKFLDTVSVTLKLE